MANTLLTIGQITNEALSVLENQLVFTKKVNRGYDDQFAKSGAKVGNTINIRKPPRYLVGKTPTIQLNGTDEDSVPLSLTNQYNVGVSFTSQELTLDIDNFSERILVPAMAAMANEIDHDGMALYQDIYNLVGTPATPITALTPIIDAGVKLDNGAAPNDGMRCLVLNPRTQGNLVTAGQAFFNPAKEISKQYGKGSIGEYNSFDVKMSQNVNVFTAGVRTTATGAMNGAVSSGNTLVTDGWTNGDILAKGETFTIAGVFGVNPQSRETTGELQQFVALATATAAGAGDMTITVAPALVFGGKDQTVTSASGDAPDGAAITPDAGSGAISPQNMAFHRDAFTFGTADLEMPVGAVGGKRVSSKKLGLSMRWQPFYDGTNDRSYYRVDLLGGWSTIRRELAARLAG